MTVRRAPVVVGVDGSAASLDAVDWAAAEAATRGCPLRVVHAFGWIAPVDPFGVACDVDQHALAGQILDGAVDRARAVAPNADVRIRLVAGPAAQAMIDQTRDADLVVLGCRGQGRVFGGVRGLFGRSTGVQVVARAGCPVAIVRLFHAVAPGPSAARVVVGIDGSTWCGAAVGYAFQAADQRGVGLTALHAWLPHGPADLEGTADTAPGEAEHRMLRDAVGAWTQRYPSVAVEAKLVRDHPARALVAESAGAALTVVASHARRGLRGTVVCTVSRRLLRDTHSPMAVLGQR